jgi:hypothetical protein
MRETACRPLFLIKKLVEMIVTRVHPRRRDALGFPIRQLRGPEAPAHAFDLLYSCGATKYPASVPLLETGTASRCACIL